MWDQASSPETTPRAAGASFRPFYGQTDGPAMPTPRHNQPGQAFPPSYASRESPSCFTHEPLQACKHCLVLVRCWLLAAGAATTTPSPNPIPRPARARRRAANSNPSLRRPPTPSRGSIRRGWRGGEDTEGMVRRRDPPTSPLAAAPVRGGTGATPLQSLVRSIPSSPQLSSRAGSVKLTVPEMIARR